MDEHEDDEDVHHEVVDDAHRHKTANEGRASSEERQVHRRHPQAHAGVEHHDDEHRNEQVGNLLRNAELCSQRMVLLQEQVVLDPDKALMTVILLRQPGLVVGDLLARAARRRRLHEERGDDAEHAVQENHESEEHVHAARQALEIGPEREMDAETGDDQDDHRDKVDPVGDDENERMRLTVVCKMCHPTSPPKGS